MKQHARVCLQTGTGHTCVLHTCWILMALTDVCIVTGVYGECFQSFRWPSWLDCACGSGRAYWHGYFHAFAPMSLCATIGRSGCRSRYTVEAADNGVMPPPSIHSRDAKMVTQISWATFQNKCHSLSFDVANFAPQSKVNVEIQQFPFDQMYT